MDVKTQPASPTLSPKMLKLKECLNLSPKFFRANAAWHNQFGAEWGKEEKRIKVGRQAREGSSGGSVGGQTLVRDHLKKREKR